MNKKLLLLVATILLNLSLQAQAPHMFSYQAVVRNAQGNLVSNSDVRVKISILQGTEDGVSVYTEQQVVHTNQNGLFTLNIGEGSEGLVAIDWEHGPYYIRTEVDPTGGYNYSLRTVQQMMSVPYALHAYSVDTVITSYDETDPVFSAWNKDYNDLTNRPDIPTVPTNVSAFTNDAGYLTSFTESQILTISNDTIYLTGGSFVKLPASFSGDYNDLTNRPNLFSGDYNDLTNKPTLPTVPDSISAFVNDAGYLTSFTESQILTISNDTIYLTGGSFVKLPTSFSGDYNDLTNKPDIPTVPTNVSELTNDANYISAESQILSISNDTIYLTGGSFVKLPASFSGSYNDLTDKPDIPTVPTNVSELTNDANYISVESQILSISNDTIYLTGGSFVKLPASFSGSYNDLTDKPDIPTVPTNVSELTNDANYISIESQILSISNDTIYLTGGSFVKLPAGFSGDYNDLTNTPNISDSIQSRIDTLTFMRSYTETDPMFNAWNKDYNDLTNTPNIGDSIQSRIDTLSFLRSYTESQILSISNDTIYLTGGSFVKLPAGFSGDYNDMINTPNISDSIQSRIDTLTFMRSYTETDPQFNAWNKDYNDLINTPNISDSIQSRIDTLSFLRSYTESQILSISNDTIYLTGGSFVKLPASFSGDYNDLTNTPAIPTVPTNVSELTNDANYISTESQILSISNDTIYLTGGSFVKLPASFSGDYNDLTNTPTIPTNVSELTNDANFISAESQILSISNDTIYLTGGSFVKLPASFSGSYNDLTDTPTIPTVPTNVSELTNDANYISAESQILSISNDTIYLTGGSFVKLPAGFSGDYNDLVNKPTIPTVPTNVSDLTNDANYISAESQILSISNDTIYLTGGSFVKLPASFSGDYNDLSNTPTIPTNVSELANDANYISNESQILSISNDTIYLTGGSFVKLPTNFSGDYNDLANKPTIPTVPTNVSAFTNDAGYLTSFTESQILSISNDTIYLTGGSFVKLPAGFSGDYNDLSNTPAIPTNVSELTNDANYISAESQILSISNDTIYLTGGSFVKLPANFSGDYNDLVNKPTIPTVPTNVSELTNDAGYLTSFTESQILSISNDTIYLTGGSFVKLPTSFSGDYNDLSNKPTIPTLPTNVSAFTNDAGYLTSFTESQILSISNDTIYLTGGSFVKLPAGFSGNYEDLTNKPTIPTLPTNVSAFTNDAGYLTSFTESQILSISNDTIYLTGGSFVKLPASFSGDYNDLANKPTIPTVPTNVSAFTNDAGYLTSFTESQILSISNDTIYLTGGSFVKLPASFSGDYNDMTNKPNLFSGNYEDLTNKPNIPTVPTNVSAFTNDANYISNESQILSISNDTLYLTGGSFVKLPAGFSGDYNDMTNKPNLFSGNYEDLTNKPNIPTVPTNVSAFTNDAGYINTESQTLSMGHDTVYLTGGSYVVLPEGFSGDYNDLANKPTMFSGNYNDLTNKPSFSDSVAHYESEPAFNQWLNCGWSISYDQLLNKPNIRDTVKAYLDTTTRFVRTETDPLFTAWDKDYDDLTNKPNLFSGNYNDLTNKPSIPTVPANVSAFANDAGYLTTESQTLSMGHDTIYLTGGSYVVLPAGFSGDYNDLVNKPTIFSGSYNDLTNKPDLFSGSYNDLTNRPNIHDTIGAYLDTTHRFDYYESDPVFTSWLCGWSVSWDEIYNKPTLFSGDYNDLAHKPNIHDTVKAYLDTTTQFLRSYTETQNLADVLAKGNSANDQQIKNVADPTAAKDAVNKQTVDAIVAELRHYYDSIIDYQRRVIDTLHYQAFDETGASKSQFSVSASTQVRFSRGNLQYIQLGLAGTNYYYYQFAQNQYDILGSENTSKLNTGDYQYYKKIDLFLWASGMAGTASQPYSIKYTGTYTANLPTKAWGKNAIRNGGNTANMWRGLSQAEWNYLLGERTASTVNGTPNARYANVMVDGMNGRIIFPDVYTHPSDVPQPTHINQATDFSYNQYTMYHFKKMEAAGVIFLPCAGAYYSNTNSENDSKLYYANDGFYWTTTRSGNTSAHAIELLGSTFISNVHDYNAPSANRNVSMSVRLVIDVE